MNMTKLAFPHDGALSHRFTITYEARASKLNWEGGHFDFGKQNTLEPKKFWLL